MSNPGKSIAYHIASGDFGMAVLKGDFSSSPVRIDEVTVFSASEEGGGEKVRSLLGAQKGRYVKVSASFSPSSRFVRRAPVDSPAKAKAPNFLADLMQSACKINPEENEVAALLPNGAHYDADAAAPKDILFVGAATKDVSQYQDSLVSWGAYPVSLEISSLSNIASAVRISSAEGRKSPTLVLEFGEDQSFIYIVNAGVVDFSRQVPFGFKSMLPQIKSELGLADEAVAKKILWANTFDFTEMAPVLLRRLVKEIQASVGFYEVQTGFATGQIFMPDLPARFSWMVAHLSRTLSLDAMQPDFEQWADKVGITLAPAVADTSMENLCWSVFAQVGNYE